VLVVSDKLKIPLAEFSFQFARSSGPGGQNVNKVNTKVQLRWAVTRSPSLPEAVRQRFLDKYGNRINAEGELQISSTRYRDQKRNQEDCLEKLAELLRAVAEPPKKRKKTRPTRGSKERRLKDKKQQSERKEGRRGKWDS
jgi:ribosome-associated protein